MLFAPDGDAEMMKIEDHVKTSVTATAHDTVELTCRQGEHSADDEVIWYRGR